MAHLSNSYTSFESFLARADGFWTTELNALNSSGADGTVVAALSTEDDGTPYLKVAVSVTGATPGETHFQHIHGLFDEDGNPVDSVSPTLANDTDLDGQVEVLEGLATYGDILLSLNEGGIFPTADAEGNYSFIATYDLSDANNLVSPVTGTQYTMEDLMPLMLREIVVHGVDVPAGIGEGTGGEVDGSGGYTPLLPAAAGEIEVSDMGSAMDLLTMQRMMASDTVTLGDDGAFFAGGLGDDDIAGGAGDDFLAGGEDDDMLAGMGGNDSAYGGSGDDNISGGDGDDSVAGGSGMDVVDGNAGDDMVDAGFTDTNIANAADMGASGGLMLSDYDNGLAGGAGNDTITGRAGDDIITGDDDSRVSAANGTMFDEMADGSDVIHGGDGNDEIHTGTWSDSDQGLPNAHMGMADDTASGGNGDDILRGAGGNDLLGGDAGNDNIGAGGGNDMAFGGIGNDVVFGGSGDDSLGGGGGMDVVDGDAGDDTVDAGAIDVNMANAADMGASGSLTLADYDNAIAGGAGNDLIRGRAGDDIITGDDDSRVSAATDGSFDVNADGMDTIYGGGGNDEIHGGTWSDSDQGLTNGSTGMMGDWISGGDGNDILRGAGGADVLGGDAGDDNIGGGGGNDSAYGGAGVDVVDGNDGDDVIFGGGGDDFLFGGAGADRFNHEGSSADGTDEIGDFSTMEGDLLVYSGGMAMLTGDDFSVSASDMGLGDAGTDELSVTNDATGQVMFTIADGAALMELNIEVNGMTYDLLA